MGLLVSSQRTENRNCLASRGHGANSPDTVGCRLQSASRPRVRTNLSRPCNNRIQRTLETGVGSQTRGVLLKLHVRSLLTDRPNFRGLIGITIGYTGVSGDICSAGVGVVTLSGAADDFITAGASGGDSTRARIVDRRYADRGLGLSAINCHVGAVGC